MYTTDNGRDGAVSANTCFEYGDVSAGERIRLQVILTNSGHRHSKPVTFTEIEVMIDGLPHVVIQHLDNDFPPNDQPIMNLDLHEEDEEIEIETPLRGKADLTVIPSQTRVFVMTLQTRDTGDVKVSEVIMKSGLSTLVFAMPGASMTRLLLSDGTR